MNTRYIIQPLAIALVMPLQVCIDNTRYIIQPLAIALVMKFQVCIDEHTIHHPVLSHCTGNDIAGVQR